MTTLVLTKTNKGREEIATRKFHLAGKLRRLLVIIDGRHSKEDVVGQLSGLGLGEEAITELLENEFIQTIITEDEAPAEPMHAVQNDVVPPQQTAATASQQVPASGAQPAGETPFLALYSFYTHTIKSTLGLRGFALQLKVERAGTLDELRNLSRDYLEAVHKAKGKEVAESLRGTLEQLLHGQGGAAAR